MLRRISTRSSTDREPGVSRRSSPDSIIGLDIARFAAASSVMLYHLAYFAWNEPVSQLGIGAAIGEIVRFPEFVGATWWGWIGVQVFFVISGILIPLSAERRTVSEFIRGRILRLVPALWFFATVALVTTALYSSLSYSLLFGMYTKSLLLFPRGPWLDGVYWTLCVEVVFYLGIALSIATGLFRHLDTVAAAAAAVLFLFYTSVVVVLLDPTLPGSDTVLKIATAYPSKLLLLTTGPYFLTGLVIYLIFIYGGSKVRIISLVSALFSGAVGIWLEAGSLLPVTMDQQDRYLPVCIWLGLTAWLALSLEAHTTRFGLGQVLVGATRGLGLATYPLYLVHNITGAYLFGLLISGGLGSYTALGCAVVFCLLVSVAFAWGFEPYLRVWLRQALQAAQSGGLRLVCGAVSRMVPLGSRSPQEPG